MKVGALFKDRERHLYPSPEDILAKQVSLARKAYAQHDGKYDDLTLLAFLCHTQAMRINRPLASPPGRPAMMQDGGAM